MGNKLTIAGRDTCGLPDPKLDTFADLDRACHRYLLRKNHIYRKASEDACARHIRIRERVKTEVIA